MTNSLPCIFQERQIGRAAKFLVCLSWTAAVLRNHVEKALGIPVRSLKFQHRDISNHGPIDDLGLTSGSVIFVNSPMIDWIRQGARPRLPGAGGFRAEVVEKRVAALMELGFERDECERALRAAQFNLDRATDYLLSGTIPEPLVILPCHPTVSICTDK
jgi:hypothetical protein